MASDSVFDQADTNHDGQLSRDEFRNLVRSSVSGPSTTEYTSYGATGGYGSSAYRSSTFESSSIGGGLAGDLGVGGGNYGSSAYESSYRASVAGLGGADAAAFNAAGAAGAASIDASSASFSSTSQSSSAAVHYETDEQGNFKDANPQIVHRPAPSGPVTLTQNIRVRFLQPPPVPPPGVSEFTSDESVSSNEISFSR